MKQVGLPFQAHSATSAAAARSNTKRTAGEQLRMVLAVLRACPNGATDEQVAAYSNIAPNAARPRRIELVRQGLVYDSGKVRATASGRNAVVWCAVPHGTASAPQRVEPAGKNATKRREAVQACVEVLRTIVRGGDWVGEDYRAATLKRAAAALRHLDSLGGV